MFIGKDYLHMHHACIREKMGRYGFNSQGFDEIHKQYGDLFTVATIIECKLRKKINESTVFLKTEINDIIKPLNDMEKKFRI